MASDERVEFKPWKPRTSDSKSGKIRAVPHLNAGAKMMVSALHQIAASQEVLTLT